MLYRAGTTAIGGKLNLSTENGMASYFESFADKLSISSSAVNLYIANAKHKLGAKTREQAIARAIFSGEITL